MQSSITYVTGAHNIKTGFQFNWGPYENTRETNADIQQVYATGRPISVTLYNSPVRSLETLTGDLGLYVQDTWTINRLTIKTRVVPTDVAVKFDGALGGVGSRHPPCRLRRALSRRDRGHDSNESVSSGLE